MANSADPDQLIWIYTVCNGRVYPGSAGLGLTHCSQETPKGQLANNADPDHMLQNTLSDQGLHCLQTV